MKEINIINLYENLENELKTKSVYINNKYSREFEDIKQMLDIQYKVYVIILNNAQFYGDEYFYMTFSIAYKNILSIYTCLKLNMIGLYGEANIIYRNIFESLMIGKFVLLTNSKKLYRRWICGNEIQISNDVFQKIKKPKQDNLKLFWEHLCKWSHATVFSGQIISKNDYKSDELKGSICILKILLIINYNFMVKNADNKSYYYMKRYGQGVWENFKSLKIEFNFLKRRRIRNLSSFSKLIISDFSGDWKI